PSFCDAWGLTLPAHRPPSWPRSSTSRGSSSTLRSLRSSWEGRCCDSDECSEPDRPMQRHTAAMRIGRSTRRRIRAEWASSSWRTLVLASLYVVGRRELIGIVGARRVHGGILRVFGCRFDGTGSWILGLRGAVSAGERPCMIEVLLQHRKRLFGKRLELGVFAGPRLLFEHRDSLLVVLDHGFDVGAIEFLPRECFELGFAL